MDILLYLLGILFVILGIALSIGLHELGHFAPAKLFGVRVKQFMIGFGPTFFSKKRGETEFGLKAFPLGGYILMAGMYPTEAKEYKGPFAAWIRDARQELANQSEPGDEGRQFFTLKPWQKSIIMLGGPLMNFFLGVLLIAVALSGIGTLQNSLTVHQVYQCVDTLADGSCPAEAPIGPAQQAGMQAGDRVLEVNSQPVLSWDEATNLLSKRGQAPSELVVDRGGQRVSLSLTPLFRERAVFDDSGNLALDEAGNPITELRPIIGVRLQAVSMPVPLTESVGYALGATGAMFGFILELPQQVYQVVLSTIGVQERDPYGAVSIVGVGQLAGELTAADIGVDAKLASLLLLLGSLNIALFAFNLIPLLPLDGGHVLGAVYEQIKRGGARLLGRPDPGPIDTARALPIAYAMWVVLIFVGLLLILADLINPIGLG